MAIEPTQVEPVARRQKEPKESPMEWFKRQSRLDKIAILAGVPLVLCCLCVGLASLIIPPREPTPTLTPTLAPTNTPVPLPTPSGLPTVVFAESVKKQVFQDWVDAQSTGMGDEEARAETARGWGITMDHVKAIVAEGVQKSWMPTATPIPIPPTPKPTRVKATPTPSGPRWHRHENAAVAVAEVRETLGPMFLEAAPGYTYICFYVNYAHIGSTGTVFVSEFDFRLEVDNVIYEPTLAMCEPGLKMVDLMPGGQIAGWVTFEAPVDFKQAELLWETPGLFGPTISIVTLRPR